VPSGLFNSLSLYLFFRRRKAAEFFLRKKARELRLTLDAGYSAGIALGAALSPWARKGAGHNFALQNYCSPMQPGLQRKSRKPAAGGLRNWSSGTRERSTPRFFARGICNANPGGKKCAKIPFRKIPHS
jgi:hypothetical protein